ncbi:uncharacterized protein LOC134836913 isoform X2 [Culicoides brevitarsis]|uniref:uncharacterized protein LOC134836913 isoform X2 n=1 Tax=Culicoides brevitarsis TaxID=469753 RepID=UPI00307B3530
MVLSMKKSFNKEIKNDQLEELHYGPGIVSKLRCRYMSLTLNQGCTKQRPSLNILRRSTSLNNLIETADAKVLDQDTNTAEKYKMNGDINTVAKSYETLLEPKENEYSNRNCETPSENDQPPTDVVKEKLRIFEPNWMNTKKIHFPKKYVANKHSNGFNSKKVTNICEKYQENIIDENIPSLARKIEKNKPEIPVKNSISINKIILRKPVGKSKSDIEIPIVGANSSSKTDQNEGPKKSQKHAQASVETQSMIFNFSNRKEIPSHLPDVSNADDNSVTVVDYEDTSSPSKFEFINANIVFEGKSCMKTEGRNVKLKIKFNDLLTSTFEYPSENCLFDSPSSPSSKLDVHQVLVVSKNGTETTENIKGCKTDSKAFWSDETHSTDILF